MIKYPVFGLKGLKSLYKPNKHYSQRIQYLKIFVDFMLFFTSV